MDPSMSNWGIAQGYYNTKTSEIFIDRLAVIQTKPDSKNKQVRKNSKDLERLAGLVKEVTPYITKEGLTFCEVPHGSQSSSGAVSYGVCLTLLGAMKHSGVSIIEVSAKELLEATIGAAKRTKLQKKKDTMAYMWEKYPKAPWPIKSNGSLNEGQAEHMADAIGSIEAGMQTQAFQMFLKGVQ